MDIIYLFRVLMRKRIILIVIPLISGLVAFLITFNAKRQFKSSTQLETGFSSIRVFNVSTEGERYDPYEVEAKFNNLIEVLSSKIIISMVSYELLLHDLEQKDAFRKIKSDVISKYTKEEISKARLITQEKLQKIEPLSTSVKDEAMVLGILKDYGYDYTTLKEEFDIHRQGLSDYVTIEYSSENPELSAYVANILARKFIQYNESAGKQQSAESIVYLEGQLSEKKKNLDQKKEILTRVKDGTGNEGLIESYKSQIAGMERDLQTQTSSAESARLKVITLNNRLNGVGLEGAKDLISTLNQKLSIYQSRTDRSSKDSVLALKVKIQEIRESMEDVTGANGVKTTLQLTSERDQAQIEYQVASQAVVSLSSQIRTLEATIRIASSKSTDINALNADVNAATNEYLETQKKYNDALGLSKAVNLGAIRQAIIGLPADEPEPSKTIVTTLFAGVISFAACIFGIIFSEYIDTSVKIPSIFQRQTDLKLIGLLNELEPGRINKEVVKIEDIFTEEPDEDIQETTFRELIRKLRFEIENTGGKTFLFTSTKPQEGKTSIIMALACSLSTNQKKILVIDTNFMNNTLTQLLNANPSLENSMINDLDHEFIVTKHENIVTRSRIKNVDIIGCEGGNYSPSEVFPERKFSGQIVTLASTYDYIFLEGGALNLYSDSKELSNYVDKVVAIFSAKSVIKPADKESIMYLKGLKNKLVGAVLNRVDIDNLEL